VLAFPVLGAIAVYAISLRIGQHGLTPDRVWAAVGAGVLSCYGVGYAVAVVRRGEPWLPWVRAVNVGMSLVVIALAFGLHTPLGDPLGLSLRNQLARLSDGRASWETFDYSLVRFELGHAGADALREIRQRAPSEDVDRVIGYTLAAEYREQVVEETALIAEETGFTLSPAGRAWPVGLLDGIRAQALADEWLDACDDGACIVFAADLTGDGVDEEIVASGGGTRFVAFASEPSSSTDWKFVARATVSTTTSGLIRALREHEFASEPSLRRDLVIGNERIEFDFDDDDGGSR
jgi:hypothetical protein